MRLGLELGMRMGWSGESPHHSGTLDLLPILYPNLPRMPLFSGGLNQSLSPIVALSLTLALFARNAPPLSRTQLARGMDSAITLAMQCATATMVKLGFGIGLGL